MISIVLQLIGIFCLIIAAIIIYVQKLILLRAGYKVHLLIHWLDSRHMRDLTTRTQESGRRRHLTCLTIASYVFFAAGILFSLSSWWMAGILR